MREWSICGLLEISWQSDCLGSELVHWNQRELSNFQSLNSYLFDFFLVLKKHVANPTKWGERLCHSVDSVSPAWDVHAA